MKKQLIKTEDLYKDGIITPPHLVKDNRKTGSYMVMKDDDQSIIQFLNSELACSDKYKRFTFDDRIDSEVYFNKLVKLFIKNKASEDELRLINTNEYSELILEYIVPELTSLYYNEDDEEYEGVMNFEFEDVPLPYIIEDINMDRA